ncbi:retrovirus-related Pol polyprotein from transposon opus [Trichonephila clavipes]|nr:retrovirus-related Pol polyprotein from transposon opus [Trichonephila clavipes]
MLVGSELVLCLIKTTDLIAFASRTLNKEERNYTVTERECLAVIWTLNKFKTYFGSLPVKVITDHAALTKLTNGKNLSSRMIRWALKLSEFNIEWEHRPGVQNVVADVLSRNPVGNMDGSQISCAALRALALNSREQLIREQREDPELGHIYRYLENPDDGSVNATVCKDWSQDFKIIDGLLFYAKYSTTLGELRVYIPRSLHESIMKEFHDLPLAGHLGKKDLLTPPWDQSIAGPSHLRNARQGKPPTEGSTHDMNGQYVKARETRTTTSGTNRAAERRLVRSKQATAVRPCPYYLRSHVKQPEGVPEDRRSIGIESKISVSLSGLVKVNES